MTAGSRRLLSTSCNTLIQSPDKERTGEFVEILPYGSLGWKCKISELLSNRDQVDNSHTSVLTGTCMQ